MIKIGSVVRVLSNAYADEHKYGVVIKMVMYKTSPETLEMLYTIREIFVFNNVLRHYTNSYYRECLEEV